MARVLLDHWYLSWLTVSYKTETGRGRARWFGRKTQHSVGRAYRRRGRWYVRRSDPDGLFFQAGRRTWRLDDPEITCALEELGRKRRFTLTRHGELEFELTYRKGYLSYWDPTFDDLDDELEDFFLHLSRLWHDPSWQQAFMTPPRVAGGEEGG